MMSMRPSPSRSVDRASSHAIPPSSSVWRSNASGLVPRLASKTKTSGSLGPDRARLVRIALAYDQFVISVGIKIGAPDGVAPLYRFRDHLAAPE